MTSLCLVLALSLTAAPANELHSKGFKAELLVDASEVRVGDVVITKLRVVNQDRIPLLLWAQDVPGSGYARYEFRRDEGEWQEYRLLQAGTKCIVRGQFEVILAPQECQSELMLWEQNRDGRRVFCQPGIYQLRARYTTVLGEVITPEIKVKVSKPTKGDTIEQKNFPLRLPWEFKVSDPVNFLIADAMEDCNSKQILRDVKKLNDFLTTGKVDGQPISPGEFMKWIDKQNPVRRECLLAPLGNACESIGDVEGMRQVLKRMPDRSSHHNRLRAQLEELEIRLR